MDGLLHTCGSLILVERNVTEYSGILSASFGTRMKPMIMYKALLAELKAQLTKLNPKKQDFPPSVCP